MINKRRYLNNYDIKSRCKDIESIFLNYAKNTKDLFTFLSICISCPIYYQYLLVVNYYDDIFVLNKTKLDIKENLIDELIKLKEEYLELCESEVKRYISISTEEFFICYVIFVLLSLVTRRLILFFLS